MDDKCCGVSGVSRVFAVDAMPSPKELFEVRSGMLGRAVRAVGVSLRLRSSGGSGVGMRLLVVDLVCYIVVSMEKIVVEAVDHTLSPPLPGLSSGPLLRVTTNSFFGLTERGARYERNEVVGTSRAERLFVNSSSRQRTWCGTAVTRKTVVADRSSLFRFVWRVLLGIRHFSLPRESPMVL